MNFTILWQHLSDPEYVHVLINPLPVYGLSIAVLALALALFLRTQRLTIAALVLVFVCSISAWPTYSYGEAAYDRVKAMSDPAGEQWLDEHMARGMKMIWMFYVLAGVAAIGVVGNCEMAAPIICGDGGNACLGRRDPGRWWLHRVCRGARSAQRISLRTAAHSANE